MAEESVTVALRIGKYEVVRELGSGGFGTVYEARDTSLFNKRVALKLLNVDGAEARAEMIDEIKRLSSFNDPFILATTDWGESDGRVFMVTEFVEGDTLTKLEAKLREKERIPSGSPIFDPLFAASFGFDVARALMKVHLNGVVHKDLKPDNVIVELESGGSRRIRAVKLIDFGLATQTGVKHEQAKGTAWYVAPEVLQARPVSPNTDVYSLGCMLFEMVSGHPPYDGSIQEITNQHVSFEPPPMMTIGTSEGEEEFAQLVVTMMSKEPAARATSTMRLVDQLGRIKAQLEGARTNIVRAPGPLLPAPTQKLPTAQAPAATTDNLGLRSSELETRAGITQGWSRRSTVLVALVLLTIAGAFVASRLTPPDSGSPPPSITEAPLAPVTPPEPAPSVTPVAEPKPIEVPDELAPVARPAPVPVVKPSVKPAAPQPTCVPDENWRKRVKGDLRELEATGTKLTPLERDRAIEPIYEAAQVARTSAECARVDKQIEELARRAIP
ncbi:MAG: protein kinase [Myxococcaceae bacterium]|jgi:serine/threonine-protein kinase|nr:protein kinase [Myxococcaceae bacterium]